MKAVHFIVTNSMLSVEAINTCLQINRYCKYHAQKELSQKRKMDQEIDWITNGKISKICQFVLKIYEKINACRNKGFHETTVTVLFGMSSFHLCI